MSDKTSVSIDNEAIGAPSSGSRSRRLIRNLVTAAATRGIAGVAPLILVPLTLTYLGQPVFGLWMTVLSLTSMALWSDFGLGSGLLTQLTRSLALSDRKTARMQITSAYVALAVIAGALGLIVTVAASVLDWPALLNASDSGTKPLASPIATICLLAFAINIPLSLVQKIQYAAQQATASNIWQGAGSLASLGAAGTAVFLKCSPTVVVAAVALAAPATSFVNTVVHFSCNRDLAPRLSAYDSAGARLLLALGARFFAISILTSVALNVDNLVISHTLGLAEVAHYAVAFRAVSALGLVITFASLPFWSVAGEALARGDIAWVRKATLRMILGSAASVAAIGSMIVLYRKTIFAWLSPGYEPPLVLLTALVCWWVLVAGASPLFSVQNASAVLKYQLVAWLSFFLLSLPLKVLAAKEFGIGAVPLAGAAVYGCALAPIVAAGYRHVLRLHGSKRV